MRIVIVGSGRLGYHLARKLTTCNKEVLVVNRKENEGLQKLKNEGIQTSIGWELLNTADVVIFCIKDDDIEKLANQVQSSIRRDAVVLHTSGSVNSKVLERFDNYGVLYPLYSFTFEESAIQWSQIPIYYVACNNFSREKILNIAKCLNDTMIYPIDDEQKRLIHLLAVFANNFTTALSHCIYTIAKDKKINGLNVYNPMLDFALQSWRRLKNTNPALYQTGPAIRGDEKTITKHLEYLKNYPEILSIYQSFTEYISKVIVNEREKK